MRMDGVQAATEAEYEARIEALTLVQRTANAFCRAMSESNREAIAQSGDASDAAVSIEMYEPGIDVEAVQAEIVRMLRENSYVVPPMSEALLAFARSTWSEGGRRAVSRSER